MRRRPQFKLALATWHEWLIYFNTALLVATGVAWLLLSRWGGVEGEFGAEPNPALPWLLTLHGVAAYAFVVVTAMLLPVHVRLAWNASRNRWTGLATLTVCALLIVSGLMLYYSSEDGLRSIASLSHWVIGFVLPVLIGLHVLRGRRSR